MSVQKANKPNKPKEGTCKQWKQFTFAWASHWILKLVRKWFATATSASFGHGWVFHCHVEMHNESNRGRLSMINFWPGTSWWYSHWWVQGIWGPATWQITTPHLTKIITWIFPPPERSREQCGDLFWSGQGTYGVENFRWLLTPGNISHLLKNYNLSRKPVTR